MKQFGKLREMDDVIAEFECRGWIVNTERYDGGGDWIYMNDAHDCNRVIWSPFNGRFRGTTIAGVEFSHDSSNLDDQPWYQELLNIFYVETEYVA